MSATTINYFLKLNQNDQIIPYALTSPIVTIGSAPEVTISLPPKTADERHCRIERKDNNQFVIRDLRSSTGTFVNNTKILEAFLHPGDIIRINEIIFEFTCHGLEKPKQASPYLQSRNSFWQAKLENIPNLARTPFPVLLLGPSGSGKEIIAQQIHENSSRRYGPFMSVNCSALAENLIESELFGHLKGSFTGAINDRKGAFEAARGGTLFLDEIGDLPYSLQAKLLRALENSEIRALGSDKVVKTDVRIIAATHQNLHQKITDKTFRTDLFYRLNVITIDLPSLMSRMEDFDDIFYSFCKDARIRFSFQAIQCLKQHTWPGNIRELKNIVARASAFYPGRTIDEKLVKSLLDVLPSPSGKVGECDPTLTGKTNLIKEMEKQMILNRLIANKGNQRRTANELGMPKSTLHDRLKSYEIDLDNLEIDTKV